MKSHYCVIVAFFVVVDDREIINIYLGNIHDNFPYNNVMQNICKLRVSRTNTPLAKTLKVFQKNDN